jgi:ATP-dependent Clp protease ATP-binding subunit ClpA
MFERFTPEARRSLELASAVATGRGDAAISPDHLLAGLANPTSGLASELLAEAGVDEEAVAAAMPQAPGGTGPTTPPFTASAKKALELSLREALNLAHAHIGSGHLLLGLLRLDEGAAASVLGGRGVTLDTTRDAVRLRSEGARLGGRRRPRRTGRIVEALTAHEREKLASTKGAAGSSAGAGPAAADEEVALRLASEEGSRLQRALASLGVTPAELQEALAEVAADPADDGPVHIDLGGGVELAVATGPRAADLRSLVTAADHVTAVEGPEGTLWVEAPALGDAVWATLEGWLTA